MCWPFSPADRKRLKGSELTALLLRFGHGTTTHWHAEVLGIAGNEPLKTLSKRLDEYVRDWSRARARYRASLSPSPEGNRLSALFCNEKSEKPLRIRAAQ